MLAFEQGSVDILHLLDPGTDRDFTNKRRRCLDDGVSKRHRSSFAISDRGALKDLSHGIACEKSLKLPCLATMVLVCSADREDSRGFYGC